MARFMIEVEDGMSKEMEAKVLNKLYEAFAGTDTYLEQLFTAPFVSWVNTKIRDDIFPEVMQYIHPEESDELRQLRLLADSNEKLVDHYQGQEQELKEQYDALKEAKQMDWDRNQEKIQTIQERLFEERERVRRHVDHIADLEQEVLSLKAKLYDEMTKEG